MEKTHYREVAVRHYSRSLLHFRGLVLMPNVFVFVLQVLWCNSPNRNQQIAVAQALPSSSAMWEPKQEGLAHDTDPNAIESMDWCGTTPLAAKVCAPTL